MTKGIITVENIDKTRSEINTILREALAGYTDRFKTKDGYVMWGRVETAINEALENLWQTALEQSEDFEPETPGV